MDPITHGLTGALLGKAFFADREEAGGQGPEPGAGRSPDRSGQGRVAVFAATLGAVIPDGDVVAGLFSRNALAILQLHRSVTHSFVCLPVFAVVLAALTHAYARRRNIDCPSWPALVAIYAVGLASHILLDLITSFGTMIFSPLSNVRVSWDLTSIVDFVFTAIVLLPQLAARVYARAEGSMTRATKAWVLLSLCAAGVFALAGAARFPFSGWVVVVASLIFAAVLFLPARHDWGFRTRRSSWCRAGVYVLAGYLLLCGIAHHVALRRIQNFAAEHKLIVERVGALPLPPSPLDWVGLIRTPNGVYQEFINVLEPAPPAIHFYAAALPNGYIAAAEQLREVKIYLWFARFPVVRYSEQEGHRVVEFSDVRFFSRSVRRRHPFTFRVVLNSGGEVVKQGWADD